MTIITNTDKGEAVVIIDVEDYVKRSGTTTLQKRGLRKASK